MELWAPPGRRVPLEPQGQQVLLVSPELQDPREQQVHPEQLGQQVPLGLRVLREQRALD